MLDQRLRDATNAVHRALGDASPPPFGELVESATADRRTVAEERWRGPVLAAGAAAIVVIAVVIAALVGMYEPGGVGDVPGSSRTSVPAPSTSILDARDSVEPTAGFGTVALELEGLANAVGEDLAGMLMRKTPLGPWEGVAGFAVHVDSDPFSVSQVLGDVDDQWPADTDVGLWPWPSGTALIGPGDYTLYVWSGTDYCCYSRWMPAETPNLRGCEYHLAATGTNTTIRIAGFPDEFGPCVTDPATAATGTIRIGVDGLTGMNGYQLLATVESESHDPPIVGGALWTSVDADPFTDTDRVHPARYGHIRTEVSDVEGWAAEDYLWDVTAQLTPGAYRITLWASPGGLAPYGSHLPMGVERQCTIDIDVVAGLDTQVAVSGIPAQGSCELATESSQVDFEKGNAP
jgi:hypothetical protein